MNGTIKESKESRVQAINSIKSIDGRSLVKCAVYSIHPISKISSIITRTLETIIENDLKDGDEDIHDDKTHFWSKRAHRREVFSNLKLHPQIFFVNLS